MTEATPPSKRARHVQASLLSFFAARPVKSGQPILRSDDAPDSGAAERQHQDAEITAPEDSRVLLSGAMPSFDSSTEHLQPKTSPCIEAAASLSTFDTSCKDTPPRVLSKSDVVCDLSDDAKALLADEIEQLPACWLRALLPELTSPAFARLKAFLGAERAAHSVFPPAALTYAWAAACPMASVRVVIIGQDPYHNDGQAHGLAFSVPGRSRLAPGSPATAPPPSLANIFKELRTDIPAWRPPPKDAPGDLSPWAAQGVLLLNTALSVRAHAPASHAGRGWEALTDAAIRAISAGREGVVFMLWGAHAQRKAALVDDRRHLVLQCAHPSPLSASRGFLGCRHFSRANEYLSARGSLPVQWSFE